MRVGPRTPTEPRGPALDVEAGEDDGALPQVRELVLRADPDGDALVDQVAHQADDEVLVLEDLEEAAHGLAGGEGLEVGGDAARTADVDRFRGPAGGEAGLEGIAGLR